MDCAELEDVYASCGDVCAPQCDQAVLDVYQCGREDLPCGDSKNSHAS